MLHPFLKTFRNVAQCGSFNMASQKLFLSATAVRKQMNLLEDDLGLQLFIRDKHGVHLTEEGKSLYNDLDELFELSRKIICRAKGTNSSFAIFRVGTSLLNPATKFIKLFKHLDEFKGYSIQLVQYNDNREGILAEIEKLGHTYDILFGACDSKAWLQRCQFHKLGDYAICCAVPPGHRLFGRKLLQPKDFCGERIVLGKRGDSVAVDKARDRLERLAEIMLEEAPWFYDLDLFNKCEQESKLLLTLECWKDIHPAFATVPIKWNLKVPYGLLYQKNPARKIGILI